MIILLIILLILHILLFYNRQIRFYAQPYNVIPPNSKHLLSCVEGTVVYVKEVTKFTIMMKLGRGLEIPDLPHGNYTHIGIYMSPYNNHHLLSLDASLPFMVPIQGKLLPMLDDLDSLFPWLWRSDWYHRKVEDFISLNQRYEIKYKSGIVMCMIMDKYVNKLSMINEDHNGRRIIGFVHRGSQLDMFIPNKDYYPVVYEGDKVNFNTIIASKRL